MSLGIFTGSWQYLQLIFIVFSVFANCGQPSPVMPVTLCPKIMRGLDEKRDRFSVWHYMLTCAFLLGLVG